MAEISGARRGALVRVVARVVEPGGIPGFEGKLWCAGIALLFEHKCQPREFENYFLEIGIGFEPAVGCNPNQFPLCRQ